MGKVFVIAEAGINHNGNLENAKKMFSVASDAGADAVKFQTFKAEEVISRHAPKAEYQKETTDPGESQLEMAKKLELSKGDFEEIAKYCEKHKLTPYIPRPMQIYPKELQINRKLAEKFYFEARELQFSSQGGYREWAYRKAAWSLDDLGESVEEIFQERGINGIMKIKGIGKRLAKQVQEFLKKK